MTRVTLRQMAATLGACGALVVGMAAPAGAGTTWPTYHADPTRSGVATGEPALTPTTLAWSNPLDHSAVYGQPVIADGRVFVADENDQVYALDGHDGHVLWSTSVGVPLGNVARNAGCGNIDPLGITSTPVLDLSSNLVYVVAEVSTSGGTPVHHQLVGLSMSDGSQVVSTGADPVLPPGEDPVHIQQRGALAVANGRVYVAYGGLSGDCGVYHGWLVGVDARSARPSVQFEVAPDGQGGAIWGPGGPAVDGAGNVYVTTGNPNPFSPAKAYTESAVKLSPDLAVLASFQSNASGDADLASDAPTLLPDGTVFAVGKADVAYVLRQSDLGVVATIPGVCGSDPDGGNAYDAATHSIYVPCRGGGIQQVDLSTHALGWKAGLVNSAPILVNGSLWALQYGTSPGRLQQLDPTSGAVLTSITTPTPVPTFASPSAALGLLTFGTTSGVVAYTGPGGPPPPAGPIGCQPVGAGSPSYLLAGADGGVYPFGQASSCGSLRGQHLNAPIVALTSDPGGGYRLAGADGGVFAFGDAGFFGSAGNLRLNAPVVGMAATPDGGGYWLVASDGGVFAYGDAGFHGSAGNVRLARPVVGMAATPDGGGYWLVASDGGVFAYGDAGFFGSAGNVRLNAPVAGMASTGSAGYWLVASDGGVFAYGNATFHGSAGHAHLARPVVGMAATPDRQGYWLLGSDGGVFAYGDAPYEGSLAGQPVGQITAITAEP